MVSKGEKKTTIAKSMVKLSVHLSLRPPCTLPDFECVVEEVEVSKITEPLKVKETQGRKRRHRTSDHCPLQTVWVHLVTGAPARAAAFVMGASPFPSAQFHLTCTNLNCILCDLSVLWTRWNAGG